MELKSKLSFFVAALLVGCAGIPELPRDFEFPVRRILQHCLCELRETFKELNSPEFKRFKPDKWLIAVSLAPKTDSDVNAGVGMTRKHVGSPTSKFVTWVLGQAPGLQLDVKGEQAGQITYNIKSGALIADTKLNCERSGYDYHVLARHLGISDWLRRSIAANENTDIAEIDKPQLSQFIRITLSGSGSYTFAFALGSDLASFGGNYILDEQLNISMTRIVDPPKFDVVTLPTGGVFKTKKSPVGERAEAQSLTDAKSRLDLMQLEQAIRNSRPLQ